MNLGIPRAIENTPGISGGLRETATPPSDCTPLGGVVLFGIAPNPHSQWRASNMGRVCRTQHIPGGDPADRQYGRRRPTRLRGTSGCTSRKGAGCKRCRQSRWTREPSWRSLIFAPGLVRMAEGGRNILCFNNHCLRSARARSAVRLSRMGCGRRAALCCNRLTSRGQQAGGVRC